MILLLAFGLVALIFTSLNLKSPFFSKPKAETTGFVVDHHSVTLFDQIPEDYLQAAMGTKMMFADRSVGWNINEGLNCLSYPSDEEAPNHCKRYSHLDSRYSVSPGEVNWSRAGGYNRSNWSYYGWPGTGIFPELPCGVSADMWWNKINCFIAYVDSNSSLYDIFSYQNSYLEVDNSSDIINPTTGFFVPQAGRPDVSDLEALEARHPDKKFIYWTSSLARSIGGVVSKDFNNQMREYATAHNKILFDVADIESYDPSGNHCYDNRDGVEYRTENYPDDGQDLPAICPHYTSEVEGGHLGSVSAGKIRIAKAYWVLMARLAGWNPEGPLPTSSPTSTPTQTPTPTPLPAGTDPVYYLNFDNEDNCSSCTFYNTSPTSGIVGEALEFNGTSAYINAGKWNYLKGQNRFTLTVWVRPDFEETDSVRHYVFGDGVSVSLFNLNTITGWRLVARTSSSTVRVDIPNLNWTPGEWHMLAFTYDGSSFKLYWDGQLNGSVSATGVIANDSVSAQIGMVSGFYWRGAIDELKIYNSPLSETQILDKFTNKN